MASILNLTTAKTAWVGFHKKEKNIAVFNELYAIFLFPHKIIRLKNDEPEGLDGILHFLDLGRLSTCPGNIQTVELAINSELATYGLC